MPAIKLDTFGGMVPAVDDKLLQPQAASYVTNAWMYPGRIEGMHEPTALRTNTSAAITRTYRIPTDFATSNDLRDAAWMDFEHPDTTVLRAPVIGDTYERYYWCSPAGEAEYNTRARIEAGSAAYVLGVPAPGTAPGVSPSGGVSSTTETRSYVYTWVTTYGEEGPPSDPTTQSGKIDDTWAVTVTAPGVGDTTDRTLAYVRIYRTVTDALGNATYYLLVDQAIADTTYTDTAASSDITTNNTLESTNWSAPPTDLEGWIAMPNGIIAGWRDNEVWFSEPYRPHAWPSIYAVAVEYPIVGLGVVGQTLIVCTTGFPSACSGVRPSSMSLTKLSTYEPCVSRGSIISAPEGVYYASPNGLVLVSSGRVENITRDLITKDRWQDLVEINTLRAARLGTAYYAFGSTRPGVFQSDTFQTDTVQAEDFTGAYAGVLIDPQNARIAFALLQNDVPCDNVFNDPWTGEVLLVRDGSTFWLNLSSTDATHETYLWRSKEFHLPEIDNWGAAKVFFEVPATTPTQSATRNNDLVQTLAADQYGLLRVYADGRHVATRELRTSGELLRLPSGFKAQIWQFEVEARVHLKTIYVARTVKDLKRA